jgi:hypothetical protein
MVHRSRPAFRVSPSSPAIALGLRSMAPIPSAISRICFS